jgi:hypothetical protein
VSILLVALFEYRTGWAVIGFQASYSLDFFIGGPLARSTDPAQEALHKSLLNERGSNKTVPLLFPTLYIPRAYELKESGERWATVNVTFLYM